MNCISVLIYDGLIGHARNLRILECQIRQGYFRWNTYIYHLCLFPSFSLFMFRLVLLSILNIFKYNSEFIYLFFGRNKLTSVPFHIPCVSVMHPWISIPLKNTCQKVSWLWIWSIWALWHYILWIWLFSVLRKLIVQLIVAQWQNGYWRTVLNLKIWIGMEHMSYQ